MSQVRTFSSPELAQTAAAATATPSQTNQQENFGLEGVATNVKLLLKLINDHTDASTKDMDDRKSQRVAGMMTILDDVKARIQKSHSMKNRRAELRRCNTDLRPRSQSGGAPKDKKQTPEIVTDDKERLRRQLYSSLAARKSLEIMCSSLGKEKEIIASELARKVQELNATEELINDLKSQNENIMGKLQHLSSEQKDRKATSSGGDLQGNAAQLLEKNKELSEQLLRSFDGYRSLKRKYKDAQEENVMMRATVEEMRQQIEAALEQISEFRRRLASREQQEPNIEAEILTLQHMFEDFQLKISKPKKGDCVKSKGQISARKPSVLA